jgi:erythromycin esterase-like protein
MRFTLPPVTRGIIAICSLAGMFAMLHATETNEVVEWIRANAIRLETPAAGHGFADMQPLKKVVGDARIVALGEATHGTREFFQLKHRMLEFLATKMGFTIFSIEANMPEAYRLNDFVLNGKGDPVRLIKGMYFWTWDTQEVLDMVLWMLEFNKSGKGRLQFTGFDMQTPNVAAGIVNEFVAGADPAYAASLRQATDLAKNASPTTSGNAFGVATATFPVKDAAGKRIRFSGYIKTEGVTTGYAGLWWRVDGPSGVLAFDNMQNRGVSGTTDWKRYDIELPVAADAKNINFGALFPGNGTAWFDELTVELDGTPYVNNTTFDLDFESSSPKGFYTGGNGYRVQLDSQVFHSGKQSLRMTRVAPANDPKGVDPKLASSMWKDVVRHLETSREAYGKKGADAGDIEWAIQNARVVLQGMQMRANEATRDKSMADNVKWIVDSNPGAKIVLWAHNGHVSTASAGRYGPMGTSLREMFGAQMVVFGFAFND